MVISQTPLRISFLGGNTDFPEYHKKYGGLVLTTAIDKYVYCVVTKRFDDQIRVNYSIKEIVEKVSDVKHEMVREAMIMTGVEKEVEISFLSDVPGEGSGLGSSSAVTVGVLNALHTYKGDFVSAQRLAEEACVIERDILKKPIGIQDQYICALGGLRELVFPTGGGVINLTEPIRDELNNSLMLFYTGITRKSSDILSKLSLDKETLDRNVSLARDGIEAVKIGDVEVLGNLLHEYWETKKTLSSGISNLVIDQMYQTALERGAYGGKICGAGGGGFLLLVVPPGKRNDIRVGLSGYRELPFRLALNGSRIILNI